MTSTQTLPASIEKAIVGIGDAFYNSVPFQRVARVREAREDLVSAIADELASARAAAESTALMAAAQICESRSRTLRSKPAQIEALQCGSAISTQGRVWLARMRDEQTFMPQPDAGVDDGESVGTTTTEIV